MSSAVTVAVTIMMNQVKKYYPVPTQIYETSEMIGYASDEEWQPINTSNLDINNEIILYTDKWQPKLTDRIIKYCWSSGKLKSLIRSPEWLDKKLYLDEMKEKFNLQIVSCFK